MVNCTVFSHVIEIVWFFNMMMKLEDDIGQEGEAKGGAEKGKGGAEKGKGGAEKKRGGAERS